MSAILFPQFPHTKRRNKLLDLFFQFQRGVATDLRNFHVFALPSVSLNAKPTYGEEKKMIEGLTNQLFAWQSSRIMK